MHRTLLGTAALVGVLVAGLTPAPAVAAPGGTGGVSGKATYHGAGVGGIVVTARTANDDVLATTTTGADGAYALTGIPVGLRSICFDGTGTVSSAAPLGYVFRCYGYAPGAGAATPVRVIESRPRTGIDQPLAQPAVLTGVVRDAAGTPLQGVTVALYNSGTGPIDLTAADGSYRLTTDADYADYAAPLAVADGLTTAGAPFGFVDTYASRTRFTPGVVTTVPPIVMDASAAVGGTVTDWLGNPLAGVDVTASYGPTDSAHAVTGSDGTYQVVGIPGDSDVRVWFDATGATGGRTKFGFVSECWDDVTPASQWRCSDTSGPAGVLHTVAGHARSGVDAALSAAGAASGVVRDAAGRPIGGAVVRVVPRGQTYGAFDITADDGTWHVTGLTSGRYSVCSSGRNEQPPNSYQPACLGGGTDPAASNLVTVHLGQLTASPDLTLTGPGTARGYGAITGRFVDARGRALDGLRVYWSSTTVEPYRDGFVETLPDGRFRVDNVPVDAYDICVGADENTRPLDEGNGLAPICFHDTRVASRSTTDTGTVTVPEGGRVSGRITDVVGYELYGWQVFLRNLDTGAVSLDSDWHRTGDYVSDPLVPGSYSVCAYGGRRVADDSQPARGFAEQCWRAQVPATPTPVTVTSGVTVTGIDFRMKPYRG